MPPASPTARRPASPAAPALVKAPVYQQLNELLRGLIRSGELQPGQQFLTERQIAERFEVSRATANKALSNLVSEGILSFRKGVGTFVEPGTLDVDLRLLVSFTARAEAAGRRPATRVLGLRRRRARELPAEVAQRLALPGDAPAFELERLRLADGEPVIHELRFLDARPLPDLDARQCAGSLYTLLRERYRLRLAGAEQRIRAVALDAARAGHLDCKRGSPALEISAVGYLEGGVPLWHETTVYRADSYAFVNRLGNVPGAGPGGARALQFETARDR